MAPKIFRKTLAAVFAAAMLITPVSANMPEMKANAAPDEYHDDWLHVNENAEIVDMDGNPVWMTGVNWFGYNVGSQIFDGAWSANVHHCLDLIADHGFNLLRVPMSTEILLQWKAGKPDPIIKLNEYENPELTVEGVEGGTPMYSFDIWNQVVKWCRENGIKIMMDIHSATTNAAGHNYALWYDSNFSEKDWLDALSWFADYYKDDDTVIAIDLKNEPHGKTDDGIFAKWDGSTDANNWRYAAEKGAMACLEKNPNLLIMVEGIEVYPKFEEGESWASHSVDYARYPWSPYHGAWWGANFRGVKEYPVDLGKYQSQLVYSPHDYGPEVWKQEWFYLEDSSKTFTRETLLDDYWRDTWAYLAEDHISPLLMGEWGGWVDDAHDKTGENRHWLQEIRDYMTDMRIHHTFWCFNENSSDTGGLVYDNFQKWDDVKYDFIKSALWQTTDGKFISLDHKIPMGRAGNGISLGEFYSSGAKSNMADVGGSSGPKTTTSVVTTASNVTTTTSAPVTTTTSAPKTTQESTTIVTTTVSIPDVSTHQTYKFNKVETYPTKTEYTVGEYFDPSGLTFSATPEKIYDGPFSYKDFVIVGYKDEPVSASKLVTLPAGEYTIKMNDTYGGYYTYNLCNDIDITYKVTIKEKQITNDPQGDVLYGDSNCSGDVDIADAVLIMQTLSNPAKYKLTAQGEANADCYNVGDGVTNKDALAIQKYKLTLLSALPEK